MHPTSTHTQSSRTDSRQPLASVRGFTLIELLVSVALFSLVMSISIGTLLTLVDASRKAQSLRMVTDNLHFALDSMARNIRTGYDYSCSAGCTVLTYTNDKEDMVRYTYNSGFKHIEREIDTTGTGSSYGPKQILTATDVQIDSMRFYVTGNVPGDAIQPTVTIVLQGTAGGNPKTDSSFDIQTTVTQRLLDI